MDFKKLAFFVAGIALTLGVLGFFGFSGIVDVLLMTRPEVLAVLVLMQLAVLGLFVIRLKMLAHGKGYLSFGNAARITMSGMFVSMITPIAKIGGEPLKIYMLRRNIGGSHASAVVAMDSLVEIFSSLAVILAITIIFINALPQPLLSSFALFLVIVAVGFITILKILLTPRRLGRIVDWTVGRISKFQEVEKKDYTTLFYNAFNSLLKEKALVAGAFLLSIFIKIIEISKLWLVFAALRSIVPFPTATIVWALILVLLFIPWLPGSLGLVEFGGTSAFILFGLSSALSASAILLDRLISFWLVLFIGFVFASRYGIGEHITK